MAIPSGRMCDLCGSSDFESIAERDRRRRPLETVVCRNCGLVSHAQIPTDTELELYYASQYRSDYHGEFHPSPYRVVREWGRCARLVEQLLPDLKRGDTILEIGSGIGCTVMNFALAGFDAGGIEPGEGFCQFSRETMRANVRPGLLEDLPRTPQYDVVLLVHVLEHLPRPTEALEHIHQLLRPGGRLYVEVPNFAAPHAAPGRQFHFAHIYNFTPATLRMLAAKCGYHLEKAYFAPWDRNIGFLLGKGAKGEFRVEGTSYTQTMEALRRYSTLSYHLRPRYLAERALTFARHMGDRFLARWRMEKIIARCTAHARSQARSGAEKKVEPRRAA